MNASTSAPRPAASLSNLVNDLAFAERLVLWAMRMWGAGYRLGHSADDVLAKSFEKAGMAQGRQCLEEFMVALTAGAARGIGLQCVCRKEVSDDERLLLDALRLSQRHFAAGHASDYGASFLLEDMLTDMALPIAAVKAQALAAAFNNANLRFPQRGPEAAVATFSTVTPGQSGRAH